MWVKKWECTLHINSKIEIFNILSNWIISLIKRAKLITFGRHVVGYHLEEKCLRLFIYIIRPP